tara:strand:- start:7776 stop:10154 length:2379 start_codon:yes stop_codon:yes gene_type:complete
MSLIVEVDFFNAYIARHVRSSLQDDFFCQNGVWLPGATLPGPYRFERGVSNYPSLSGARNIKPGPGTEYNFFGDPNPFRPPRRRKRNWLQGAWTAETVSGQGWGPVTSPNIKKYDFVYTQYLLPPFFSQEKQTASGFFGRNIFQKIRKRIEGRNSGSLNAQTFELQVSSLTQSIQGGPCEVYIAIEQCEWDEDGVREITRFDKKYLEEIFNDGNGNIMYGAKIEIGPSEDFRRLLYIIGNDGSCGGDGDNENVRENLPITYAAIGPKVFYGKKFAQTADNWYLEEGRIRGGFNNPSTGQGVRAYLDEPEPLQQKRINTLIYSGIYNSRTGINQTNVFSIGTDITKSLDPSHGSIQMTHAEDTNLIVFQENRIHRALIDKDVIYTTESGTQTQAGASVIGQFVPYKGDYGISKNPESFAIYNYRKYFSDRNRNAIMRLSNDGLTEISNYGMLDWFRDNLALIDEDSKKNLMGYTISNVVAGSLIADFEFKSIATPQVGMKLCVYERVFEEDNIIITFIESLDSGYVRLWFNKPIPSKLTSGIPCEFRISYKSEIIGGWDIHNKQYVVSLQKYPNKISKIQGVENNRKDFYTLVFDEKINGWVSFMSYKPDFMFSVLNKFYTTEERNVWEHYNNISPYRTSFYSDKYESNITFVFNQAPSSMKNFTTIHYEGGSGWEVEGFTSGREGMNSVAGSWVEFDDTIKPVKSYEEGLYYDAVTGQPLRAGFVRKENKYVANIISDSVVRPGEVRFGPVVTGIKGYFTTVKVKTDETTDPGGLKELWSAGTEFITTSGFS